MSKKRARVVRGKKQSAPRKIVKRKRPLESHDDPIVADNADVQIDFTREPHDLDQGKVWVRTYTTFLRLDQRRRRNGEEENPNPQMVKDISSLTFSYSKPGNNDIKEKLVYATTGNGAIVLSVEKDKLKHKPKEDKRFLVPDQLTGLRLRTVDGEDPNGQKFTIALFDDRDRPMFDDVQFTIVAVPHPHEPSQTRKG